MEACVLDSPVGHLLLQSQGEALTLLERTELAAFCSAASLAV